MNQMTRRLSVINDSMAMGWLMGVNTIGLGVVSPRPVFAENVNFVESKCGSQEKKSLWPMKALAKAHPPRKRYDMH